MKYKDRMVSASVPSVGHDCAGNVLSLLTAFTTREAPLPAGASLSFRSTSVLAPSPGARRCEQLRSMTCLFGGPELASPTLYCSCRCSGTWLPPSPLRGRSRTTWFDLGGSALKPQPCYLVGVSAPRCSTSSGTHAAARPVPAVTQGLATRPTTAPDARGPIHR